jgi:DNA-directed RNA polymerase subunit RPC12/RpoP
MAKVKELQIRCSHCKAWFRSPIMFGGTDSFDTSTLIGNQVQCPACGKMTGCNKENMRVHFEGGGFVGDETV